MVRHNVAGSYFCRSQCLHDIDAGVGAHATTGAGQDADNLGHTEAIKELTHPDGIGCCGLLWECLCVVQQVDAITGNTVGSVVSLDVFLHHGNLLWQVEHRDMSVGTVVNTAQCPLAGIAAHIVKRTYLVLVEYDMQGFVKRRVTIEVVETEPTLLHL